MDVLYELRQLTVAKEQATKLLEGQADLILGLNAQIKGYVEEIQAKNAQIADLEQQLLLLRGRRDGHSDSP